MKKNNFVIIGGQYAFYSYGFTPTLTGAKRLARKNLEYWDNWQGWHVPEIYRTEDVEKVTNFYKFSMLLCFSKYRTKKDCQCAIDAYYNKPVDRR